MRSEIRNQKTDELTIAGTAIYPEFGKNSGFTLMELLVTISIIAILAAILLPTINSAIERSEVAQAEAEVQSIATAVQAYYNEYSKLPIKPGDHGVNADWKKEGTFSEEIIKALAGIHTAGAGGVPNPREIVFIKGSSDLVDGIFLDPWGQQYIMTFDYDYDNVINYEGDELRQTVIVISSGPDESRATGSTWQSSDDVFSIEVD